MQSPAGEIEMEVEIMNPNFIHEAQMRSQEDEVQFIFFTDVQDMYLQCSANDVNSLSYNKFVYYDISKTIWQHAAQKLSNRIQPWEYPMNPFNPTLGLDTNTLKGSRGRLGVQFLGPRLAVLPCGKAWLSGRSTNKRESLIKTIQMIILIKNLTIKTESIIIKT